MKEKKRIRLKKNKKSSEEEELKRVLTDRFATENYIQNVLNTTLSSNTVFFFQNSCFISLIFSELQKYNMTH